MNQKTFLYGFTTTIASVGAGVTAAAFVVAPANTNYIQFQVPRNDISMSPLLAGQTLTLANLVAGASLGVPLTTMPVYRFEGSFNFVLFSVGAAASVPLFFGQSAYPIGASLFVNT